MLQLAHLLDRKPKALSGGQRQRVAIGRTLVAEPSVFLLDEPLSNLDAALRVQMRIEISRLHKRLGRTMIYVTHDQVEAMTLADKIVVLDAGRVAQVGKPLELYHYPADRFVAGFIGSPKMNFLPVKVTATAIDQGRWSCRCQIVSKSGCQLKAVMSRLEPICRWVFARNIYCRVISLTSSLRVKFRSSSNSATKLKSISRSFHSSKPGVPPERRGVGRRRCHIRYRPAARALPSVP